MPKKPSDKLFHLIKSLSGSEKRYFRIQANKKEGSNKYLELFDAIDQQDYFDDAALQRLIYGEKPQTKKYSELKNYLFEQILLALQGFDHQSSIDFRLKNYLLNIRVLYKRSHFQAALEQVKKVKRYARQYEHFLAELEGLRWEKAILYAQTDIAGLDRKMQNIETAEQSCYQKLENLNRFRNAFLRLLILLRKDAALRGKKPQAVLNSFLQNADHLDIQQALSHSAKVQYYRTLSVFHYAKKDMNAFYQHSKEAVALLESRPDLLQEDASEYISALSNWALGAGWLKRYEEVQAILQKFRKVNPITLDDELKIHRQYYMNKFALCIVQGEFEEGLSALSTHQKEVKRFNETVFRKHTFFFQSFYLHFGAGDFEKALEDLNEWLHLSGNAERQDLQSLARILNLLIHFEMGNTLLLESLIRSTYRYWKKQTLVFDYEKTMLQFFRQIMKAPDRSQQQALLRELEEKINQLFLDPKEKPMLELFNIRAWVTCKILNRSFSEVVKQNYQLEQATGSSDDD
jgi:hypothetical protein